jgi:hypothetical protein
MMEEARQRREEAKVRREMEAARRAAQEAADKRRHEREMYVLNNTPDMAERLTNTRIRQTESIMKQAQDRVRFQDERNREYVGKIKVEKMQRGERFDKDIEVLFEQFGLDAPSIESMKRPSVTEEIRLGTCKNRHYVYSRLFTGVRRLHQADNNGYVEFMNGDRMTLPGTAEGLLATVVEVMPYVYMIHVYYYDPEYLASLGYQINKNPFDCCKNMFGCTIQ